MYNILITIKTEYIIYDDEITILYYSSPKKSLYYGRTIFISKHYRSIIISFIFFINFFFKLFNQIIITVYKSVGLMNMVIYTSRINITISTSQQRI